MGKLELLGAFSSIVRSLGQKRFFSNIELSNERNDQHSSADSVCRDDVARERCGALGLRSRMAQEMAQNQL